MKKILYLILITLLLMPVVTYAAKDNETVETEVTEEVKENKNLEFINNFKSKHINIV